MAETEGTITLRLKRAHDGFVATLIGPRFSDGEPTLVQRYGLSRAEACQNVIRDLFEVEKQSHLAWNADNGKPKFEHDCEACEYLGTFLRENYKLGEAVTFMDAYVCPQDGYPTIVLRTSDDCPDYASSSSLVDWLPAGLQGKAVDLMNGFKRREKA